MKKTRKREENLRPFSVGDKRASECGRIGGTHKRGKVSLKRALNRALADGTIDVEDLIIQIADQAKKNPGYARLMFEYNSGKPAQDVNISDKTPRIREPVEIIIRNA